MPKPNKMFKVALLCSILAPWAAYAQAPNDSVLTVDELLRIENAQIRDVAKKAAIAAGLVVPPKPAGTPMAGAPRGPQPPTVIVHAIKGVGTSYRVDLTYNGELHKDVAVKSRVKDRFVLERVQDACVSLSSLDKAFESSLACWSGFDPEPAPSQVVLATPTPGSPLPPSMSPSPRIPSIPPGMPMQPAAKAP